MGIQYVDQSSRCLAPSGGANCRLSPAFEGGVSPQEVATHKKSISVVIGNNFPINASEDFYEEPHVPVAACSARFRHRRTCPSVGSASCFIKR